MTKTISSICLHLLKALFSVLGMEKRDKILTQLAPGVAPVKSIETPLGRMFVKCPSKASLYWTKNALTHEPETINWIQSFTKDDIYWDIGANIGIYSLFAGLIKDLQVLAFEPMQESYAALCSNILLNNKYDQITAYNIGFFDKELLAELYLRSQEAGSDSHTYVKSDKNRIRHPIICMTIDGFISTYSPSFPTRIKIDVDGPEYLILTGATATLKDQRLRELMIEFDQSDEEKCNKMERIITECGFIKTGEGSIANLQTHVNYFFKRKNL